MYEWKWNTYDRLTILCPLQEKERCLSKTYKKKEGGWIKKSKSVEYQHLEDGEFWKLANDMVLHCEIKCF